MNLLNGSPCSVADWNTVLRIQFCLIGEGVLLLGMFQAASQKNKWIGQLAGSRPLNRRFFLLQNSISKSCS
jgi:hypothetical protein